MFAGEGFTKEMYEQLRKEVDWEHNHPKGELFHAVGFDKSGHIHVTDIWESAEDFNSFVETRLMPGTAEVGIQGNPQVQVFPMHAIYVPDTNNLS